MVNELYVLGEWFEHASRRGLVQGEFWVGQDLEVTLAVGFTRRSAPVARPGLRAPVARL